MASYYEICQLLKSNWTQVYNTEQKAPYICKGNQWIGFTFNFLKLLNKSTSISSIIKVKCISTTCSNILML